MMLRDAVNSKNDGSTHYTETSEFLLIVMQNAVETMLTVMLG
jgi:hypothetical protein